MKELIQMHLFKGGFQECLQNQKLSGKYMRSEKGTQIFFLILLNTLILNTDFFSFNRLNETDWNIQIIQVRLPSKGSLI